MSNFFGVQKSNFRPANDQMERRGDQLVHKDAEQFVAGGTVLKSYGTTLNVFVPILRKDEAKREVHGIIAQEQPDKAGEIFDYASSRPHFEKWAAETAARTSRAGLSPSYGNVRAQHSNVAAGKLLDMGTFISYPTKKEEPRMCLIRGHWQLETIAATDLVSQSAQP